MPELAEPERPTVGVVGLGNMGEAIARALLRASIDLRVYDVRPEALAWFAQARVQCAQTLADIATCDLIAIIVNTDSQVLDVIEQLKPDLRSGATIVVHSTVLPATMRAAADAVMVLGVEVIDAPISGGSIAADRAALTVMVGGATPVVEACAFELSALGAVHHLGALGAGQTVKIINDLMQATSWTMALQCMEIARALGVAESQLAEITVSSTGASWTMANLSFCDELLLKHTLAADHESLMSYMSKDVRAARSLARDVGVEAEFVNTVAEAMPRALTRRLAYLRSEEG